MDTYTLTPEWTISHLVAHPWSTVAALSWLGVACYCLFAIFSCRIRDTVAERIALSAICIAAISRAFFVFGRGVIPYDGVFTAVAIFFYGTIVFAKHIRAARRQRLARRSGDFSPPDCRRRESDPPPTL